MDNDRLHRYASKKVTSWSKAILPGWWTMALVVVGVGFFLYLAYSMIAGPKQPAGLPPLASSPGSTMSSVAPVPGTSSPTAPAPSATPAPAGPKRVQVYGPHHSVVWVPSAAVEVARQSFAALYDPKAAAEVPTSDGLPHATPAAATRGGFRGLSLVSREGTTRIQFSAMVDPDGADSRYTASRQYVTVALLEGRWVFLNSAG